MQHEHFSVYQWFEDGTYERVRHLVSLDEAITAARHYTSSVAAQMGITTRVIVTDADDCICFEWKVEEGVVFVTGGKIPQ